MRRTFYTGAIILSIHTLLVGALAAQVDPTTEPLVTASGMAYVGTCLYPPDQFPNGSNDFSFSWSGSVGPIAWDRARNAIFATGHVYKQFVGEFTCQPSSTTDPTALPRASIVQSMADVLQGHRGDVGTGPNIGGLLPLGGDRMVVTAWVYYDATASQVTSHFLTGATTSALPPVQGPFPVPNGLGGAGFVSGWVLEIPAEFRPLFGGYKHLTGNGELPIITRTSLGPSLTAVNDLALIGTPQIATKTVLGYTAAHPTLGAWDASGTLFNGAAEMGGCTWTPGTRSVLCFGRIGTGPFCYGTGTGTQSLAGTPVGDGSSYCYDPLDANKGTHSYPYTATVYDYDANDLVAVFNGQKNPWDVKPVATWPLAMPFASASAIIGGATIDDSGRIYLSEINGCCASPYLRVFSLATGTATMPPPQGLTASITPKPLTATVKVPDKVYDGTTAAPGATCVLAGVVAGDSVTCTASAVFASKNVGARQASVTITISGPDAPNYTAPASPVTVVANITKKSLTVTGVTATSKVYDGTTAAPCSGGTIAGAVSGDDVSLAAPSCAFGDKSVGQNKPVTVSMATSLGGVDAGNYVIGGAA